MLFSRIVSVRKVVKSPMCFVHIYERITSVFGIVIDSKRVYQRQLSVYFKLCSFVEISFVNTDE